MSSNNCSKQKTKRAKATKRSPSSSIRKQDRIQRLQQEIGKLRAEFIITRDAILALIPSNFQPSGWMSSHSLADHIINQVHIMFMAEASECSHEIDRLTRRKENEKALHDLFSSVPSHPFKNADAWEAKLRARLKLKGGFTKDYESTVEGMIAHYKAEIMGKGAK